MTRFLACVAAAAVLAGCSLAAAPGKSNAAVLVGIGDQDSSMFTDPLFTELGVKRSRYFPAWNGWTPGVGAALSGGIVPASLEPVYGGRFNGGFGIYFTLRPRAEM